MKSNYLKVLLPCVIICAISCGTHEGSSSPQQPIQPSNIDPPSNPVQPIVQKVQATPKYVISFNDPHQQG